MDGLMEGSKDEKKEPFSKKRVSSKLYISVMFVAKSTLNVSLGLFMCFQITPFISDENGPVIFFFFWASLSPAPKGFCCKLKIPWAMSVLCYFPWNLRLQSAVRLLFPILPEDIIHPGSWLKSGISARLDNLNLRTYAFPFEKVTLCLEHNLSFLLLFLCSFGKWNIPQKFWKYLEQGDICD